MGQELAGQGCDRHRGSQRDRPCDRGAVRPGRGEGRRRRCLCGGGRGTRRRTGRRRGLQANRRRRRRRGPGTGRFRRGQIRRSSRHVQQRRHLQLLPPVPAGRPPRLRPGDGGQLVRGDRRHPDAPAGTWRSTEAARSSTPRRSGALTGGGPPIAYRTSKAAIAQFSRMVATDVAEYGIRVNCIAPGHIATGITNYDLGPTIELDQPLQRRGTTQDVAEAVLFLASDRSAQITGHHRAGGRRDRGGTTRPPDDRRTGRQRERRLRLTGPSASWSRHPFARPTLPTNLRRPEPLRPVMRARVHSGLPLRPAR